MDIVRINTPLDLDIISSLQCGTKVLISGKIYTARDAAHFRFMEAINQGMELPFDIKGQIIYYAGPTPGRAGQVIGSAGPTTSSRMDAYTPPLLEGGLAGVIGKGRRSTDVTDALIKYHAVYFAAVGGLGALLSFCIKSSRIIAYEDLGTEAVRELEVLDFPVYVATDYYGNDMYSAGPKSYLANMRMEK